jgi:hypothetical protein
MLSDDMTRFYSVITSRWCVMTVIMTLQIVSIGRELAPTKYNNLRVLITPAGSVPVFYQGRSQV